MKEVGGALCPACEFSSSIAILRSKWDNSELGMIGGSFSSHWNRLIASQKDVAFTRNGVDFKFGHRNSRGRASQRPNLVPGFQGEGESDCPPEPKRECANHGFDKPYQAIPKREKNHSRS